MTKIKLILKKVLITILLILTLFPALFSGLAYGADAPIYLTTERAGNYVSTFAINFFKNWSNINYVYEKNGNSYNSAGSAENVLAAGQQIYDNILLGNTAIQYVAYSGRNAEQICNNKSYSESNGMDCSTFVSAALWLAGYKEEFSSTKNTYNLEDGCLDGTYVRKYGFEVYKTDRSGKVYQVDENGISHELSGVSPIEVLKPGDIIVVNKPGRTNGHTNIVKEVRPNNTNKYLALDCGNENNWQNVNHYNESGGGTNWDIWTPVNWDSSYGGTNQAFLIRATNGKQSAGPSNSSKSVIETYGEIKTEYDSTRDERSTPVDASDETYKFSNKSFVDFAFKNALGLENEKYYPISNYSSSSKYYDELGGSYLTEKGLINITQMANSGALLPGDILYSSHGINGTQGDYLLYVGGLKVVYATKAYSDEGALRYENLEYYLARVKNNLSKTYLQANPNADKDEIQNALPEYGIKKIYRLNNTLITEANVKEKSENLFFNGKGYYDPNTKYTGIPQNGEYRGTHEKINIVESLKDIFWFIVSGITFVFRAIAVGWIALVDSLIQIFVSQLSGSVSHAPMVDQYTGAGAYSYSSQRISVESIFFNGIPILDANFFNFESAAGHDITAVDDNGNHTMIYTLKKNLSTWYVIVRNFSIALMLFMLLYAAIKMAIATTAEKKADCKKMLIDWLQGFLIVLFIHFFMYAIIYINDSLVHMLQDIMRSIVNNLMNGKVDELSLYEAIRTKAYVFDFYESIVGIILYIIIIYLLVRFLLIYFKRVLSVYVLAMLGSFMGVKYAWEKASGKKRTSIGPWMKDFAFNVLLQSIHCFIYVVFMTVAFSTALSSFTGLIVSLVILRFMIDADKIFMKIFGVNAKGGLFEDADKPEDYMSLIAEAGIITIGAKKLIGGAYNTFTGKNEFGAAIKMAKYADPEDDLKTAKKKVEMAKYQKIGDRYAWLEKNFPKLLKLQRKMDFLRLYSDEERQRMYKILASKNLSYETKSKVYKNIKDKNEKIKKQYTRPIKTAKNLSKSAFGILAAPALLVSSENGWALATASTLRSISGVKKELELDKTKRYKRVFKDDYLPGLAGTIQVREKLAMEKFNKDIDKLEGKQETIYEMAEFEENINKSIEKLKKNTPPEQQEELIKHYQETIKSISKTTISSSKIQRAVSTYMYKNNKKKLQESDLKDIMKELQIVLDEKSTNKIHISTGNDTTDNIFVDNLKAKFDGQSLDGLDSKKASALLVEAINQPGIIPVKKLNTASGDMEKELKKIAYNYKKLYSKNEKSKVKNKGEAVSLGAIKKEFNKKITEVK